MSLELRVYDHTNTNYLGTLSGAYSRAMVEGLNDPGTGQFSIGLNDPDIALVQPRNVVRWRLNGQDVFTSIIDDRPRVLLGDNEDPSMRVTGPSIFGWLGSNKGGAVIYPQTWKRGLPNVESVRYSYPDRYFGWASNEYVPTGWTNPNSRGEQGKPLVEFPALAGKPSGWLNGAAEWIWTTPIINVRDSGDLIGLYRFRRVLPAENYSGPAHIEVAGQNSWVLYFDGEQVASGNGYDDRKTAVVNIPSNRDVVVSAEVNNTVGIGLFILSIRRMNNGNIGNVLYRTFTPTYTDTWSGKPWKCLSPDQGTPGTGWLANRNYNDSWWRNPATRGRQNDPIPILTNAVNVPMDWPNRRAEWLWSRPLQRVDGRYFDPEGVSYFRRVLDHDHEGPARIFIAGATEWELFFDGQPIGSGGGLNSMRSFDVRFHSEPTVIGVKVTKIDTPAFIRDPAQFLMSISRLDHEGNHIGTLYRTFTPPLLGSGAWEWRALGYPETTPGLSPGHLVKVLIDEAKERGGLPSLTYDFTLTHDSNGVPWDLQVNRGFKIGTKLSYAIEQLSEYGIDFTVTPNGVLRLFKRRGQYRSGSFGNLASSTISGEGPKATTMLVRTPSGYYQRIKPGEMRLEDFVEYGDIDDQPSASALADRLLQRTSQEHNETELLLSESSPKPYVDFFVGDSFDIGRITQIALTQDDANGAIEWAVSVVPEN